jgi:hypothetical protein
MTGTSIRPLLAVVNILVLLCGVVLFYRIGSQFSTWPKVYASVLFIGWPLLTVVAAYKQSNRLLFNLGVWLNAILCLLNAFVLILYLIFSGKGTQLEGYGYLMIVVISLGNVVALRKLRDSKARADSGTASVQ